jgi:hypothetical protein
VAYLNHAGRDMQGHDASCPYLFPSASRKIRIGGLL